MFLFQLCMFINVCVLGYDLDFGQKMTVDFGQKTVQAPALESKLQESKAFIWEQCLVLVSALQVGVEWLNF